MKVFNVPKYEEKRKEKLADYYELYKPENF